MLIVLSQKQKRMIGVITTVRLVDEQTGEIIATDVTAKQGDPVRIARQAINTMLADYPGALVYGDERLLQNFLGGF